jgi:murein DD-endopeptidase MepM/ murein hydrolase activator NlpD
VVRRGDTLYSVSRSTGASVQAIAQANRLRAPYALQIGDRLTIPAGVGAPASTHAAPKSADVEDLARTVSYTPPTPSDPARMFDWPVKGAIISSFGSGDLGRRNDGVNIAAPVGTPVRAAADGEVVYRGSELEGYGNLLLVKHTDGFVTAYAHNDVMLVKKGQKVNQGQVIAKVGKSGAVSEPQLHFEIRQNLKSVDPIGFLDN